TAGSSGWPRRRAATQVVRTTALMTAAAAHASSPCTQRDTPSASPRKGAPNSVTEAALTPIDRRSQSHHPPATAAPLSAIVQLGRERLVSAHAKSTTSDDSLASTPSAAVPTPVP